MINATPTEKLALDDTTVDNSHDMLEMHFKTDDQRFTALLKGRRLGAGQETPEVGVVAVDELIGPLEEGPGSVLLAIEVELDADQEHEIAVAGVFRGSLGQAFQVGGLGRLVGAVEIVDAEGRLDQLGSTFSPRLKIWAAAS